MSAFGLDDFLWRALAGGLGVALAAGPLGSFVVWRRMAYFGDTLAHAGLLGVVLGVLAGIGEGFGVLLTGVLLALLLLALQQQKRLPGDTVLGILAHTALSLGLVAAAFLEQVRIDLNAWLFGDILAIAPGELAWIWAGGALALGVLALIWRPLLAMTVHEELARVEGVPVAAVRLVF
ncbi:metal ABC transporter permease, partial [Plasticicumulans sp.]